jgi:hypothetical protein
VRARRDDGLAIHVGPKRCIGAREGDACGGRPVTGVPTAIALSALIGTASASAALRSAVVSHATLRRSSGGNIGQQDVPREAQGAHAVSWANRCFALAQI